MQQSTIYLHFLTLEVMIWIEMRENKNNNVLNHFETEMKDNKNNRFVSLKPHN